jgi:hypothetical protein
MHTVIDLALSLWFWTVLLSVLAIVKGLRSGSNATQYFGHPIAVLPHSWQRWILGDRDDAKLG